MNQQRAKDLLPIIQAFANGQTVQAKDSGTPDYAWYDSPEPCWKDNRQYRIKPEPPKPTLRPWKPEEVPVGAQYRAKGMVGYRQIILGVTPEGVLTSSTIYDDKPLYTLEEMLSGFEYSTDNGLTWHPCGVPS